MRPRPSAVLRRRGIYQRDETPTSSHQPTATESNLSSAIGEASINDEDQTSVQCQTPVSRKLQNTESSESMAAQHCAGALIRPTRLSFTPLASENDPKSRDTSHLPKPSSLRSIDSTQSTICHRNTNRTNEKLFNIEKSIQPRCRHRNSNQTYIGKCYHGPSRFAVPKSRKPVISCKSVIENVLMLNKRQIDLEYLLLNTKSSDVDQIASKRRYHERLRHANGNLHERQSVDELQKNENVILKSNQCANQKNIGISNKNTLQPKHVETEWDSSIVITDLLNRKKSKTNASSNQVDNVSMSAMKSLSSTSGVQTAKSIESEEKSIRSSNSFSDIITSPATVKGVPSFGPSMTLIPKNSKWLVQAAQLMERVHNDNLESKKSETSHPEVTPANNGSVTNVLSSLCSLISPGAAQDSNYLTEPEYNHLMQIELRMLVDGKPLAVNFEQNFLSKCKIEPDVVLKELLVNKKLIWPDSSNKQ
ncbi:hypothetical protein DdX_21606 [Ditylenchus destructor]|uniref:Uncharacterized protein n=1 Tax=Ditylenchus destructor TaxID=166010 RepID=A0AAD4MG76_9BILA|nr:hypothetical protein DdX_21606 [Ditylenchus destructor]